MVTNSTSHVPFFHSTYGNPVFWPYILFMQRGKDGNLVDFPFFTPDERTQLLISLEKVHVKRRISSGNTVTYKDKLD